ncbi:MAG: hypothetical protein ACI90V_011906, partial [Bacillariaceae sp.]
VEDRYSQESKKKGKKNNQSTNKVIYLLYEGDRIPVSSFVTK